MSQTSLVRPYDTNPMTCKKRWRMALIITSFVKGLQKPLHTINTPISTTSTLLRSQRHDVEGQEHHRVSHPSWKASKNSPNFS
ncbi:hypothetical protein JHK82_032635 [Glycine max]|nr:hypothetical protein JHK82_032635 [Glycine max]